MLSFNIQLIGLLGLIPAVICIVLLIKYGCNRIVEHDLKKKIRFFIHLAHDIRTPVSLIKAPLSELEADATLSEHGKKLLSVASANVDRLYLLVSQLLDIQKIEGHIERLNFSKQDVQSYMQEKIIAFRVMAEQKKIDLYLEVSAGFPELLFDKGKMDKILDNLLSNAIKYTEQGYISVHVEHTAKEWQIIIQDTGIGIPVHEQKQLFKQFYRASNALKSNESGYGIGLLLTKKLVECLHGNLAFSSIENQGTSFCLTFPLLKSPPQETKNPETDGPPKSETTSPADAVSRNDTLLLAEDNNEMREYLTTSLSKDYKVISVANGAEALALAREINPDIIIADVLMPVLRGDEMCRILKSSMETSHIPLILLSALSEKENIILGLEAGANDYIIKPFDFNILKARIRNILQSREQLRKIVFSPDAGLEETDYTNELDKAFLDKAIHLVEKEIANSEFSINEFCRTMAMSRTSVYNKLKTLTDQAPNDFIRIIRLNKAKEFLASGRFTVTEVSYMVGFTDPKYFSTSFKKQFGISPSKV